MRRAAGAMGATDGHGDDLAARGLGGGDTGRGVLDDRASAPGPRRGRRRRADRGRGAAWCAPPRPPRRSARSAAGRARRRTRSMMRRCEAETRAVGTSCAASSASSRAAPGISGTRGRCGPRSRSLSSTVSSARRDVGAGGLDQEAGAAGHRAADHDMRARSRRGCGRGRRRPRPRRPTRSPRCPPGCRPCRGARPAGRSLRPYGFLSAGTVLVIRRTSLRDEQAGRLPVGRATGLHGPTSVRLVRSRARRYVPHGACGRAHRALKYFASGWWMTIASVDCSGWSWNSSDSWTPIRSGSSSSAILARSSRSGQAP